MIRLPHLACVSEIVAAASPPIHIYHNNLLEQCSQCTPLPQHYSKGWSMFAKAVNIARDVHSDLKKVQQLCKLKPKVWECLCECSLYYATCRRIYRTTHFTFAGIRLSLQSGWKYKCCTSAE